MVTQQKAVTFCKCGGRLIKDVTMVGEWIHIDSIKGIYKCDLCGKHIEITVEKKYGKGRDNV